nr:hypothetical protein [Tanacetum cinerariifolium]
LIEIILFIFDTSSPNPICLMAKATSSQAWLWHRRLSHLNFDTINLLSKNDIVIGLLKLKLVQRGHHAQVRTVRTNKGMEFLNKTLHAYFAAEGINHQTSVARTPEQNGVVERQNRNFKLLTNFVEKFLGTVKFRNDQIAPILGYRDLSTCYIRDLKGNDLLAGCRGTDLYSITLQDTSSPNPICLMAKATSSQAWLWHRRLSHLNFDTINLLSKNDIVIGLLKLK